MLFPLCEVVFVYSGIVQMCTPCPGNLSRRAGTISTPLYTFSVVETDLFNISPSHADHATVTARVVDPAGDEPDPLLKINVPLLSGKN